MTHRLPPVDGSQIVSASTVTHRKATYSRLRRAQVVRVDIETRLMGRGHHVVNHARQAKAARQLSLCPARSLNEATARELAGLSLCTAATKVKNGSCAKPWAAPRDRWLEVSKYFTYRSTSLQSVVTKCMQHAVVYDYFYFWHHNCSIDWMPVMNPGKNEPSTLCRNGDTQHGTSRSTFRELGIGCFCPACSPPGARRHRDLQRPRRLCQCRWKSHQH